MKKVLLLTMVFMLAASAAYAVSNITGTKHDLHNAGYNTDQICIFCHTPHNAVTTTVAAPLWNHVESTASYTVYSSASLDANNTAGPGGVSKACLSCHDGTIGLDEFYGHGSGVYGGGPDKMNSPSINQMASTKTAMLGTDLSNDHPIGFDYNAVATTDPEIRAAVSGKVNSIYPLYGVGKDQMECASCHAVHDNTNAPFLRASNTGSALCLGCHIK